MRNRESIVRNLEILEGRLFDLKRIVNRQEPIEEYHKQLDSALELLESIKGYVEDEDLSATELNHR